MQIAVLTKAVVANYTPFSDHSLLANVLLIFTFGEYNVADRVFLL